MKHSPIRTALLIAAALLPAIVGAQPSATLSVLDAVPATGVNIRQDVVSADATQGLSARFLSENERRGATQTFVWNSSEPMSGLGLKLTEEAQRRYPLASPQKFEIDIHELTGAIGGRKIVRKLATIPVTLTPEVIREGKYLYLKFDTPLKLESEIAYGLHIRPVEIVPGNHLHLAWSGHGSGANAYADGVASMTLGAPYGDSDTYGKEPQARDFDLVFFTTAEESK